LQLYKRTPGAKSKSGNQASSHLFSGIPPAKQRPIACLYFHQCGISRGTRVFWRDLPRYHQLRGDHDHGPT
jgi:hypothetical protein